MEHVGTGILCGAARTSCASLRVLNSYFLFFIGLQIFDETVYNDIKANRIQLHVFPDLFFQEASYNPHRIEFGGIHQNQQELAALDFQNQPV